MATANEDYLDALLRHQIFLLRTAGGISNQVDELLGITEADIIDRVRAGLTGSKLRRLRKTARLIKQIRAIRNPAWDQVRQLLFRDMQQLLFDEAGFAVNAASISAPVVLDLTLPAPAVLRELAQRSPFEGRLLREWIAGLRAADLRRIEDQIKIGIVQGEGVESITRRIVGTRSQRGRNGVTQITRHQARSVVRTAVINASNLARAQVHAQNGLTFGQEVYVATLDSRTTPICRSLDGNIYPIGQGPQPPVHVACRSLRGGVMNQQVIGRRPMKRSTERGLLREYARSNRIRPAPLNRDALPRGHKGSFDSFARRRVRELTGTVPARVSYQQFLTRSSAAFQNDVLGPTRGKLFRKGGLTLDRFVDRQGQEIPLPELAARDAQAFRDAGLDPDDF